MADRKVLIVAPQHSIKTQYDNKNRNTQHNGTPYCYAVIYAEYRYVACHYAEYRGALFNA
jgi:hypothetical protein